MYESPKTGSLEIKGAYKGRTPARRCYVGGSLVYQGFSPVSEQEFIEQTAAGGPAQLLKVYGKTIVNNQIVEGGAGSHSIAAAAFSFSDFAFTLTSGHKVFIAFNGQNVMGRRFNCQNGSGSIVAISSFAPSSDGQFAQIFPAIASGRVYLMAIDSAVSTSIVSDFISVDLTLLYGAGHEPTSVAQFLADYPEYDPTYDPGSLQSNKTAELRAYDGGTLRGSLALNLSTLTGKLNGEGASVVVFPDGLRGVGSIRDEAEGSTGVVARAVVDLGTLKWSYRPVSSSFPNGYFVTSIANYTKTNSTFLLTANYSYVEGGWTGDKTIRGGDNGSHVVYILDSAYTDAATFKAAMSGVMLDYPLATPQTYTLDTPLPTDLTCEQGDILQRVSDNNCPFVGEMRFGL